jgi:uncharacterized membrane protein YjgN (DUF898 family)
LGIYYPFWQNRRQTFMIEGSYFGDQKFSFDGTGTDLITRFLVHVALSLPTFFLCWIWYWARVQRYYAEHTSLQAARFRSTLTGGGVLALWVVMQFSSSSLWDLAGHGSPCAPCVTMPVI